MALTWALSACTGAAGSGQAGPADERTLTVYAAASLTTTFPELGLLFEAEHPGVRVVFNVAGSRTLAEQIIQGAPADVFASADEATMATVTDAGLARGAASAFATNRLVIATPPDNPAGVGSFADLTRPGLALVVCAPAVPCGAAASRLQAATGLRLSPVSEEQSVSDVLAKVQAGEADAGLVYTTDAAGAGDTVLGIDFPESVEAVNATVIAALDGPEPELGQEFVDLVLGPQGQAALRARGFGAP